MKGSLSWLLMEFSGEGLGQFCCFYALRAGSPGIPTTRSALVYCTDWKQRLYWWELELVLPHLWPQSQLYHLLQVIMGEAGRGSFPYPWHHMADKRAQGQLACSYALIVQLLVGRISSIGFPRWGHAYGEGLSFQSAGVRMGEVSCPMREIPSATTSVGGKGSHPRVTEG